jgi:hypothetical protein
MRIFSGVSSRGLTIGKVIHSDLIALLPMASNLVPITVAHGGATGPEIMATSLNILKEAGARIETEKIENLYTFDGLKGFVPSQGE